MFYVWCSTVNNHMVIQNTGCRNEYYVITSLYAVAQKDMQLHWFHHMHRTELTDHHETAHPYNRKPCNCVSIWATAYPIFRQKQAIKNDIMTTTYHQWYHVVVIPSHTTCNNRSSKVELIPGQASYQSQKLYFADTILAYNAMSQ